MEYQLRLPKTCTEVSPHKLVPWRLSMRCNPAIRRGSLKKSSKLVAHSVWAGPLLRNNLQRHLWEAKLAGEQSIQWVSLTGVANLSFPWYGSTSHVGSDSNDQPGSEHSIQLMFRDRSHDGSFPWIMVKNNLYGGAYRVS